ncbi:transposase [Streptomyces sp. HK10]|uniref:transposase n=1 Tax=Streptomyces sp. HK10 TaxID=3373255 RepID=UPI00374A4D5D
MTDPAQDLLTQAARRHHRLGRVWADSGYTGMLVSWCATALNLMLTVIRRSDSQAGFVVLPKRWLVERTFAWLTRSRAARSRSSSRPSTDAPDLPPPPRHHASPAQTQPPHSVSRSPLRGGKLRNPGGRGQGPSTSRGP